MSAESFAGFTGRLAFCFTLGQCCCVALNAEAVAVKSHCTLKTLTWTLKWLLYAQPRSRHAETFLFCSCH